MTEKIGPIFLAKGISKTNALTYFYACFICIGILAGMNFVQGYILTVVLSIPMGGQGTVTGNLAFLQEIISFPWNLSSAIKPPAWQFTEVNLRSTQLKLVDFLGR